MTPHPHPHQELEEASREDIEELQEALGEAQDKAEGLAAQVAQLQGAREQASRCGVLSFAVAALAA